MSLNTPRSPETKEPQHDKKPPTPVEKVVDNTKDKLRKILNK